MTKDPARLRVVGGTDTKAEPAEKPKRKKRAPMKDQMVMVHCAECSAELGYEYHQMVQVLRNPLEANGNRRAAIRLAPAVTGRSRRG